MALVLFWRCEGQKIETKPNSETPSKWHEKLLQLIARRRAEKLQAIRERAAVRT